MLDAEDDRQRHGTGTGAEREQPCRGGRRLRDRGDRLRGGRRRQPTGTELLDDPCRGRDAIHVHAGGISRDLGDQPVVVILRLKSQF